MALPDGVTITQIIAASVPGHHGGGTLNTLGLGSDQRVYRWDNQAHEWTLFS